MIRSRSAPVLAALAAGCVCLWLPTRFVLWVSLLSSTFLIVLSLYMNRERKRIDSAVDQLKDLRQKIDDADPLKVNAAFLEMHGAMIAKAILSREMARVISRN